MQTLSALLPHRFRHRGSDRSADLAAGRECRRDAADLLIDRDLRVISRLFPRFAALTLAVPFFAGWAVAGTVSVAITALIWGGPVRVFLAHHLTWSINSVCHTFGTCIRVWQRLGLVHNVHWPDATKLALRRSQAPVSAVA